MTKQVKLDIDISDFFVLDDIQLEGRENNIFQPNFNGCKVLMAGELEKDILTKCKNGGLDYIWQ